MPDAMGKARLIQVYEHESLRVGSDNGDFDISDPELKALEKYHGNGTPFFSLIHRGVKFNEHVGVLQAGNLTIEVLPKADNGANDKGAWQKFLITMLRAAGIFPESTSTASLKLRSNSILDLYMQLFLQEVGYLAQTGLVRKYRKTEGNTTALKGSLQFAQNIRHNLTHAERFYVRHTVYDRNNSFNAILLKTIELIKSISNQPDTVGAAASLLLDFPECDEIKVSETLFSRLHFDRKTEAYRRALSMARLLLMRYHPDVRQGANDVLALMFDMNDLWEKYVFRMLKRTLAMERPGKYVVRDQVRNDFWRPDGGYVRLVRPDIVVYPHAAQQKAIAVIDTKWKRLKDLRPADADLKQMLVYNLYNGCAHSALAYPALANANGITGDFIGTNHGQCQLLLLPLERHERYGMQLQLKGVVNWLDRIGCH